MNFWIATYINYGDDLMCDSKPCVLGIFKTEIEARDAVKENMRLKISEYYDDENCEKPCIANFEKMSLSDCRYDDKHEWNVEEVEVK